METSEKEKVTQMIQSSSRFEQTVTLTKPDKKATVRGPRGTDETLVLDGKVDDFVASESSHFPMRSLKDLQSLINSKAFAGLNSQRRNPRSEDWMFLSSPHAPNSNSILKIADSRQGTAVSWGGQNALLSGNQVTLVSKVNHLGQHSVEHTIRGEKDAKGNFVCTGEAYQVEIGYNGNLWNTVERGLR